ncbi:ArsR/SmtB family transcription factor [Desulfovibrio sp. TomC]|uniref:ArsR/SmtB family transcription factor n=1 Tax=Desulfovibrio sp. TomC TaxID=1562888 RepID=UPI000AFFB024|nr:helix-turn-helix domain-containing protein [Desulfovibrio sp. TomC]
MFKALSNPHRLTIFLKLASCLGINSSLDTSDEGIEQCQLEQAKTLGLAPSTVSNHYKELRDSGLIRMERQGKSVRCWIDPLTLALARSALGPFPACTEHADSDKG